MSKLDEAILKAYQSPAVGESPLKAYQKPAVGESPLKAYANPATGESATANRSRAIPLSEALGQSFIRSDRPGVPIESLEQSEVRPPAAKPVVDYRPSKPPLTLVNEESLADESPEEAADPDFRPMLQVDAFAWPKELAETSEALGAELDAAAVALIECGASVVGLLGASAGSGATTVLMGAARRLAQRGGHVAMVDADEVKHGLASRLGLLPSFGWEEVASGRQPLIEALIESVDDHLTLLPLCHGRSLAQSRGGAAKMTSAMAVLRRNYDLVLVDLGSATSESAGLLDGAVETVVFVQDVRHTTDAELAEACRRVHARGMACAGVIENFAPSGSASVKGRRAA